jgi:Invasion associated locus B (IalB) protein
MFVSLLRTRVSLALAVVAALSVAAAAQQAKDDPAPAKKSKSTKSAAPKAEKSEPKAAPAKKNAATPAPVPQGAASAGGPTLLGQFGDWGAYAANSGGRGVCYALAKPSSQATQPAGRPRDPAYVFISTRPGENVRNEVSVVIGYPFKPGYEASVDIGSNKYAMYTQADGAWVKNPAEEARMIDAMRKGADLVVTGESGKGTKSTDRYTLRGLAQALDRVAAECK